MVNYNPETPLSSSSLYLTPLIGYKDTPIDIDAFDKNTSLDSFAQLTLCCSHCGTIAKHIEEDCPKVIFCACCGSDSHYSENCTKTCCDWCGLIGHSLPICPKIGEWRQLPNGRAVNPAGRPLSDISDSTLKKARVF